MAPPHGEATILTSFPRPTPSTNFTKPPPPKLSRENLKRTVSDIGYELSRKADSRHLEEEEPPAQPGLLLPAVSEAEEAKCECCGMTEEYTPEYINSVRDKMSGKWICGLCSEAVKEEMEKNGSTCQEALVTHMSHCVMFNKLGRPYPVLCQAEAMKKILKKGSMVRAKSLMSTRESTKGFNKKGGITRSSSCMPSMMNHLNINND